jgi:hypothetical protein
MGKNLKPIISHAYDVDLIAAYDRLSRIEFINVETKENYLERNKTVIESFCKNNKLDFPFYFDQKIPLVIPSTTNNFEFYIGFFLISFEIPKIPAFLSYQLDIYEGEQDFVNLVEFLIYEIVKSNSPFDNSIRLEKIMQWVSNERYSKNQIELRRNQASVDIDFENEGFDNEEYSTKDYVLFHYYIQEAKIEPPFEKTKNSTKRSKMMVQGIKYGVSGDAFANEYYVILKKNNRICNSNIQRLNRVSEMLSKFPEAKKIAENELKEAIQQSKKK